MYEKAEEIEVIKRKDDLEFECMQCFSLNKIDNIKGFEISDKV
jgi:hypothetical protein